MLKISFLLSSIFLGVGFFFFLLMFKGNLLILSGPLALWAAVVSFPRQKINKSAKKRIKSRRVTKAENPLKSGVSLRLVITSCIWLLAVVSLIARISQPAKTIDDKKIAQAIEKATELFEQDKYEQALESFQTINIPELFPTRLAQKYHNIGLIQLKLNKLQQAEAALDTAIFYDAKDIDAYYLLIRMAYESDRYSDVSKYLDKAKLQFNILPEKLQSLEDKLNRLNN